MIKKIKLIILLLLALHTLGTAQVNFSFTAAQLDSFTTGYYPAAGEDTIDNMISYIVNNGTAPLILNWEVVTGISDRPNVWEFLGVADNYLVRTRFDSLELGKIFRTESIAPGDSSIMEIFAIVSVYDDSGIGYFHIRVFDDALTQVDTLFFRLHKTVPALPPPTGIKSFYADNERLVLYPNPASETIHVSLGEETKKMICISDISGKVYHLASSSIVYEKGSIRILIKELPKGIYFIKAIDKEGKSISSGKFIKGQ